MDDLVVNNELTTTIVDDESTDTALTIGEGFADALKEIALVDDAEALLDVTSFGHSSQAAVITEVKNAVGLVDRTEHVLDNDRWRRVGDEAGLFVQLAGEEIDTEVAMLTRLGGDGDADDLAGTALEDQQITNADEMAGNGDGVLRVTATGFDNSD